MARIFRYYGKKRGNRRTGSNAAGTAGEALFFAALLLIGCIGCAAFFFFLVLPQWRVNYEYLETTCRVVGKSISRQDGEEGALYRPDLQIEYEVDGQTYVEVAYDVQRAYSPGRDEKQAILDGFVEYTEENGQRYLCWYDPDDPRKVVLVRGLSWWAWLVFAVPISFVLIGGGGLIYRLLHWGKSAERSAAMTRRLTAPDPFGGEEIEFPNVPDGADVTNSPGTRLKFRLPIGTSAGWALFVTALGCLLFNGVVAVFVTVVVGGHLDGEPNWYLTLFLIPFVLGGIALIAFFVRQLLVTTGVGPTQVEISAHPLHPGERCRLFVTQSGKLKVNSISVMLVCEEAVAYRQGTNTRTETREVHRQTVYRREAFEIGHGTPFEAEFDLDVPAGAMHSFKSTHNEINWKVLVQGDVTRWPDYQRVFPVIIHPETVPSGPQPLRQERSPQESRRQEPRQPSPIRQSPIRQGTVHP